MKTIKIVFFSITLLILSNCKNKVKQNNSIINKGTQSQTMAIKLIEEIKHHLKDQDRVESDELSFKNPYHLTSRDLELASIVIFEGLKNNGFKPLNDNEFNQRIKEVFGIENKKNPYYKIHARDAYFTLFGRQDDNINHLIKNEFENFAYTENYYLLRKEHLFFEFEHLNSLIKINEDNTYKITIEPYLIHRNKYLFNNDKASLAWLFNNEKFILSKLLTDYGYDKEQKINKMVLDSVYNENLKFPEFIATLFFVKNKGCELQIRKGLLRYVEEHTSTKDNRFIYALGDFMYVLYNGDSKDDSYKIFNEDPSKKFTPLEKAEIVANIANIENPAIEKYKSLESSDVWNIPVSSLYNLSVSHPEVIKLIEEHNYFGLPKMKEIIAKLQDEAPPTGADPE